ncbi:MAG TPA: serine hydrolase [Gemmatimonas aurantiaca]|nr:serine hydrolase [Gemmatimonas aurantiaca]
MPGELTPASCCVRRTFFHMKLRIPAQRVVLLFLCVVASTACAPSSTPGIVSCPTLAGDSVEVAVIDSLFTDLGRDTTRNIKGVVVQRHGCTVAERYFNGDDSTSLHDIRSATKSITSALVLLALQQGLIKNLDQPISELLPDSMISATAPIAVRQVLTMRTGLDSDDEDSLSVGNEDRMDESVDWIAFARTVPMTSPPGERYVYSSFTAFLAGAMVEHTSHLSLQDFAAKHLFGPLGIHRFAWRRGPKGEGVGQGNLSMTTRDMTRIGELFLRGGRVAGRQVIDSALVRDALAPHVAISAVDPFADAYGYMWYSKSYEIGGKSITVHFASGNGGNKIYLVPAHDLVIAITSSAYGRGYGQRRSEQILLRILAATQH